MDGHTLESIRAEIDALYVATHGRNFTDEEQREYERLLAIERALMSTAAE